MFEGGQYHGTYTREIPTPFIFLMIEDGVSTYIRDILNSSPPPTPYFF